VSTNSRHRSDEKSDAGRADDDLVDDTAETNQLRDRRTQNMQRTATTGWLPPTKTDRLCRSLWA
jgi:hypothetical protein